MSYCRWDEGDLYCYRHTGGYATLVSNKARLMHDGEAFHDETSFHFLVRLLKLKSLGYTVPDHAIDRARQEWSQGA